MAHADFLIDDLGDVIGIQPETLGGKRWFSLNIASERRRLFSHRYQEFARHEALAIIARFRGDGLIGAPRQAGNRLARPARAGGNVLRKLHRDATRLREGASRS
jgi:hypothetical protein